MLLLLHQSLRSIDGTFTNNLTPCSHFSSFAVLFITILFSIFIEMTLLTSFCFLPWCTSSMHCCTSKLCSMYTFFCAMLCHFWKLMILPVDRRCIINMSQLYLHHRIEPKEVQPWESDLWDIIIIHRVLTRIAGLMLCIHKAQKHKKWFVHHTDLQMQGWNNELSWLNIVG